MSARLHSEDKNQPKWVLPFAILSSHECTYIYAQNKFMNMYNKVVQHVFGAILDTCTQLKATSAHYTQCNMMQHAL